LHFQEAETLKLTEATEQYKKQLKDAERMFNEKLSMMEEEMV
jgi:hypothetical protein